MVERSACAKVILCGEHAVVYGRPAIALPMSRLRAYARAMPIEQAENGIEIVAPDIGECFYVQARPEHPLAQIVTLTQNWINPALANKPLQLTIRSDIPVSSHLGSGAAVSVACARAVAAFGGVELAPAEASALAYEVEKLHHGTPSGIDNTVIAFEQPVWFVKDRPPTMLQVEAQAIAPLLVIADTGVQVPTRVSVAAVRAAWEHDSHGYERQFDAIAALVTQVRHALEQHDLRALGIAMNDNHSALQGLGVSSPALDGLCRAALGAGALGAKLSGGGQGGNMIALARDAEHASHIKQTLMQAGAARVL